MAAGCMTARDARRQVAYHTAGTRPTLVLVEGGRTAAVERVARREALAATRCRHLRLALVALFAAVALLACGVASDAISASQARRALELAPSEQVSVQAGQSLWEIAHAHGVQGVPTRAVVDWIEAENGLRGAALTPGQPLTVPA